MNQGWRQFFLWSGIIFTLLCALTAVYYFVLKDPLSFPKEGIRLLGKSFMIGPVMIAAALI